VAIEKEARKKNSPSVKFQGSNTLRWAATHFAPIDHSIRRIYETRSGRSGNSVCKFVFAARFPRFAMDTSTDATESRPVSAYVTSETTANVFVNNLIGNLVVTSSVCTQENPGIL
jgi:hypothetical protein